MSGTTETIDVAGVLREQAQSARWKIESAEDDVRRAVAKTRTALDHVELALAEGTSAPSGVSGGFFVEHDADDLARALTARHNAYALLIETERLAKAFGLDPAEVTS